MDKEKIIKMIEAMQPHQAEWAEIYMLERRKRLYDKGRAEKARAKQQKQYYLISNTNIDGNETPNSEEVQQPCDCQETS